MLKCSTYITEFHINLIDFNCLFESIDKKCIDILYKYSLLNKSMKLNNKDVKKLLYHTIIYELCQQSLQFHDLTHYSILWNKTLNTTELEQYCDKNELINFLTILIKKIKDKLPFNIQIIDIDYKTLISDYTQRKSSSYSIIGSLCKDLKTNNGYTFEKIKKFSSDYELKFLSEQYFNTIKVRHGLINN